VTIEIAIANLNRTADMAKRIVRRAASRIPNKRECQCASALQNAILTDPKLIPPKTKKDLALLIGKYIH